MPKGPTWARYEVRTSFQAPIEFVYRWCTDFTVEDSRYSAEKYERRILRRSPRRVLLEDLYDTKQGWIWLRRVVRLSPPARWHADTLGTDRRISVEYRLSKVPGNRTQLTIRARRRPYGIGTQNPRRATWERRVGENWASFARALEQEYKAECARLRLEHGHPP